MAAWIETFRGSVAPWECDITEHFTIAYYADRIDQSSTTLADHLGLIEQARAGVFPRRLTLRFLHELRAGASFHIESAAVGLDPALRLGHRIVDFGERRARDLGRGGLGNRTAAGCSAQIGRRNSRRLGRTGNRATRRSGLDRRIGPMSRGRVRPGAISMNSAVFLSLRLFTGSPMRWSRLRRRSA